MISFLLLALVVTSFGKPLDEVNFGQRNWLDEIQPSKSVDSSIYKSSHVKPSQYDVQSTNNVARKPNFHIPTHYFWPSYNSFRPNYYDFKPGKMYIRGKRSVNGYHYPQYSSDNYTSDYYPQYISDNYTSDYYPQYSSDNYTSDYNWHGHSNNPSNFIPDAQNKQEILRELEDMKIEAEEAANAAKETVDRMEDGIHIIG